MARGKRPVVVRMVVAVVVVAGAAAVVRTVFGCTPPRDQAKMVELFEADRLTGTVPERGELVREYAHTSWCDSGRRHGSSPLGPDFAEVLREYRTPVAYGPDQLRQLFDPAAAAGGWVHRAAPDPPGWTYPGILYAKRIGCRNVRAVVRSTRVSAVTDDRTPSPGVELVLSAGGCDRPPPR